MAVGRVLQGAGDVAAAIHQGTPRHVRDPNGVDIVERLNVSGIRKFEQLQRVLWCDLPFGLAPSARFAAAPLLSTLSTCFVSIFVYFFIPVVSCFGCTVLQFNISV